MTAPVVRMTDAVVGYGDRPVLRGVDFALYSGEVVVLLGPNGSGKTTLVRAVLGLTPLTGGRLELFGHPAEGPGSRPRHRRADRARIGYVPQRHTLAGGMPATVREVVASGRLGRRPFVTPLSPADRAAIDTAIGTVGLADRSRANVATLSGGQQRRVLIARALAAQPDTLVMDEPMAGVDAASQEVLAATLGALAREGRTLLVVAHELGPLAPHVQRVVALREGHVEYDGPADGTSGLAAVVAAFGPGGSHHHHGGDEP